jgi:hypothetical protein
VGTGQRVTEILTKIWANHDDQSAIADLAGLCPQHAEDMAEAVAAAREGFLSYTATIEATDVLFMCQVLFAVSKWAPLPTLFGSLFREASVLPPYLSEALEIVAKVHGFDLVL